MGKHASYPEMVETGVPWLGGVPRHWSVHQLKRSVDGCVNGLWGGEPDGENDIAVIRVADFDRVRSRVSVDEYTMRSVPLKDRKGRLIERGDLLIEKSGGGEKQLVGAVVIHEKPLPAITSNFVARMSPAAGYDSSFLRYAFDHLYSGRVNYPSIKQATGIQNLDSGRYLAEYFSFPPSEEQQHISAFLDHETAKIDRLIAKQERLIELLKEKRQAVISHAVTKGLNPEAPMKDSGVEWLGEVPAHWVRVRLKHVVRKIIDTEHKTAPFYDDGEYMVVRTSNVRDGKLVTEGIRYTDLNAYEEWTRRGKPEAGDILFTREAPAGQACLVPEGGDLCLGQRMVLFKVMRERVVPDFVIHSIYAGLADEFIEALSQGSTVAHFNMGDIGNIPLFEPPIEEQAEIVHHLRVQVEKFDALMEKAAESVALMREHRVALISAAVTGKIDVRRWQQPNNEPQEAATAASA